MTASVKLGPFAEAALDYAAKGFKVLPLSGKAPAISKEEGGQGYKDATSDAVQLREWMNRYPSANVGVATVDGLVVLDIDSPAAEAVISDLGLDAIPTLTAWTARGRHLYFTTTEPVRTRLGVRPALDVKAEGGYVVCPPSVHPDGTVYTWDDPTLSPAPLPAGVLDLLNETSSPTPQPPPQTLPQGARNAGVTRFAGVIRRWGFDPDEMLDVLQMYNAKHCDPPLAESEVAKIVRSVSKYEPAEPSGITDPARCTDLGNARLFAAQHADVVRFVPGLGGITWTGTHWSPDSDGGVMRLAKATADLCLDAAQVVTDEVRRKQLIRWALHSHSAPRLRALLELAQSEPNLVLPVEALDADPLLFNVGNGTLDLRTNALRPHDPADYLTHRAPVLYDPEAPCPRWLAFLDRVLAGDAELIAFLQRACFYSLTGLTVEQVLFFVYGSGANGKSTFLEILASVAGGYARALNFETLVSQRRHGPSEDLARLLGARIATAVESRRDSEFQEELIKQLTGGDRIAARQLYKGTFEFVPRFKLWLVGNHQPRIRGDDYAIWRRIRVIPFIVQLTEAERDRHLGAALAAERRGILNWMLAGGPEWHCSGLGTSAAIQSATNQYREGQDTFRGFLDEACELSPTAQCLAADLWLSYQHWCRAKAREPLTDAAFFRKLTDCGFRAERRGPDKKTWRLGLWLREGWTPGEVPDAI